MIIDDAGGNPSFTLSWMITWFSRDLLQIHQVQRLFDACLSQHPLYIMYVLVATIKSNKQMIMDLFEEDEDNDANTILYMIFQRMSPTSFNFEVDSIILLAFEYIKTYPPKFLIGLQEKDSCFLDDSPLVLYEMQKMYLQNRRLKNVDGFSKKEPRKTINPILD